jgi:hypothetical protein
MYGRALYDMITGYIPWGDANWKIALLETDYAPNQDTDEHWDDVSTYDASGTNYAHQTLTFPSPSYLYSDNPAGYGGKYYFKADNILFSDLTLGNPVRWVVIYYDTGNVATSTLLGYFKLAAAIKPLSQNINLTLDTGYIFRLVLDPAADV